MDNKSRIQANNAELREAIEMAEQLPDAGGGSVETCTVNITMSSGINSEAYGAWVYENGAYSVKYFKSPGYYPQVSYPITLTNVVCNGMLHIHYLANKVAANISGNCQWLNETGTGYGHLYFLLSANAGETITINLYDND